MRIDLVITELEVGGAERCCLELAKYLANRQHEVRIVSVGPFAVPPKDAILRQAREAGISVHSLDTAKSSQFPLAWWRLRRLLKKSPPDIAQSFLWHANVLAACVYPTFGVPLLGGNRVLEPNKSRHRSGAWAASRMQRVVCVSQEVADWTVQIEKVPYKKVEVVPNGIDLQRWDSLAQLAVHQPVPDVLRASEPPILLCVGRFGRQKGTDILASRMDAILNELPEYHLVIIGWGPDRPLLESAIANSPNAKRIHLLGQRDDVNQWMHRSSLLILPTRYEGMPNVVLEAMASKLPVATMQAEGVPDLLGESLDSQSVPREAWDEWQRLVVSLARDSEKLRELGAKNRQRVESSFQIEGLLTKYEQLYLNTLRRSPADKTLV